MPPFRILGLVGSWHRVRPQGAGQNWAHFEQAFKAQYPHADFVVEQRWLNPWDKKGWLAYAQEVAQRYDDGQPTLLLGFSLGGVIAQEVAVCLTKTPVVGVVAVCSPLRWAQFYHVNVPEKASYPRLSFAGGLDPVIWPFFCHHKGITTYTLPTEHWASFILYTKPAQWVAMKSAPHFRIE